VKRKEGRDYLSLEDCVASKLENGAVRLGNMSESFVLSAKEFKQLVAFMAKNEPSDTQKPAPDGIKCSLD
jgi:hypothetical protein